MGFNRIQKGDNKGNYLVGKTTIDINGKRYDANSGELLGASPSGNTSSASKPRRQTRRQSRAVDVFVRPNHSSAASDPQKTPVQLSSKPKQASAVKSAHRTVNPHPVAHHKPEKAKTLMRHTVQKPVVTMKPAIKTQAPSELAAAPKSSVATPTLKLSAHNVDKHRLERAQTIGRSQHIKRFGQTQATPALVSSNQVQPNPRQMRPYASSVRNSDIRRPASRVQTPQASNIFEAAVENARSHEQPPHNTTSKTRRRIVRASAVLTSVFVLIGFFTYVNTANIELRVASLQAGFHAQLPSYKPTGYALQGGVHSSNGVVNISFRSGDSSYQIQQQASNWDSQTLLDNVVAMTSQSHKTYQNNGRTIYIYSNGKRAAWVNAGVLYNMKITGDLSHQQIVNVAASI